MQITKKNYYNKIVICVLFFRFKKIKTWKLTVTSIFKKVLFLEVPIDLLPLPYNIYELIVFPMPNTSAGP